MYATPHPALKACFCPVCNEAYELEHVVSCQPRYARALKELENNKVHLVLRARREGDTRVYDPDTLEEDLNFARVVRATPEKILAIFEEERLEIEENIKHCDD
jgi:hypothetical protein